MACLRRSAAEGHIRDVQCDEEGCELRCIAVRSTSEGNRFLTEGDCVLQLRLRAGDVEDAQPTDIFSDEYDEWFRRKYNCWDPVDTGVVYGPDDRPDYTCRLCRSRYWCHDGDVCRGRGVQFMQRAIELLIAKHKEELIQLGEL